MQEKAEKQKAENGSRWGASAKQVEKLKVQKFKGRVTFQVQFMDGTDFLAQYGHSEFILDLVSYADASSGDLKVIKDYYVRRFD